MSKQFSESLTSPLFTSWSEQYVRRYLPDTQPGTPLRLEVDGEAADYQYTGRQTAQGAEVLIRIGFAKNQQKTLQWFSDSTCLPPVPPQSIDLQGGATIGIAGLELRIPEPTGKPVNGPFSAFAGLPLDSEIRCDRDLQGASLTRIGDGPLFTAYELNYDFGDQYTYRLTLSCLKHERAILVDEVFHLGLSSEMRCRLNPGLKFDRVVSHGTFDFSAEPALKYDDLFGEYPGDVLCRLQMPMLGEYTVPNNRGWFALAKDNEPELGMLGIMGLNAPQWSNPPDNMMHVAAAKGVAELTATLADGERHWLFYHGPVEKDVVTSQRHVFHRLHAEHNAFRLDEHLDLSGSSVFDETSWREPGILQHGYRERAQRVLEKVPSLRRFLDDPGKSDPTPLQALVTGQREYHEKLIDRLMARFELWVAQFQGFREGKHDYAKNPIGFARQLRQLLLAYELLRKDEALSSDEVKRFNAYFVFSARRIMDEGRWPYSQTWLHPDHPRSVRDFYTYPGEHKPDRLVWTNSLPNFQSDPMCALLHVGCLITDYPDAAEWRRIALDDIERNLDAYCGPSGAWEESINYSLYTFSYFVATFRILKYRFGIDYFQDERMQRFAQWLVRFFGPYDKRFGTHVFPAIGNSVLPAGCTEWLLCFASELPDGDHLKEQLTAVYQRTEKCTVLSDISPFVMAAMAVPPDRAYALDRQTSEPMPELGVAFRHDHGQETESYLFHKIGFVKDHYEGDESSFNWYAKGVPFAMDYGTYTSDVSTFAAHNLVEIPDADSLRRGYLADHMFTDLVDYTRAEIPVTLKLQHGRIRSFAEIDGPAEPPLYFYIGDKTPPGPKIWKVRQLLYVKPDYLVIFDRVFGTAIHRFNLHTTSSHMKRDGKFFTASGRYDVDPLLFVQHPKEFRSETATMVPAYGKYDSPDDNPHRQSVLRLYNDSDGIYRTVLFARESAQQVDIQAIGKHGIKVTTAQYTDYCFVSDDVINEQCDEVAFTGRVGWIRKDASGSIAAVVPDGELIEAFGAKMEGRGPWQYNCDGQLAMRSIGVPRSITLSESQHS